MAASINQETNTATGQLECIDKALYSSTGTFAFRDETV